MTEAAVDGDPLWCSDVNSLIPSTDRSLFSHCGKCVLTDGVLYLK